MEKKFRVWDKLRKQMIILDHMWLCSEYNSLCFSRKEFENHYDVWPINMDENISHYEIMMFTGLKDKNGKEIYEGDTVKGKLTIEDDNYDFEGCVIFEDGAYICEQADFYLNTYELEVIGNIYENPEKNDVQ
jgi:uncharacterized phage protein (TIGR01671 family)